MSEHVEGSGAAVASHKLLAEERQELERLRAEVAALQAARPPTARARRSVRWASVGSAVLLVLGLVLVPLSVLAIWTNNQVSDTERFVATVSPIVEDPSVQTALAHRITAEAALGGERRRAGGGPAAAIFDTVVRFLRIALRTLFLVGLIVALGAFLVAGAFPHDRPAPPRRGSATTAGRARRPWVHEYRTALRTGLVLLAGLVVIFLDRPSGDPIATVRAERRIHPGRMGCRGFASGDSCRQPHEDGRKNDGNARHVRNGCAGIQSVGDGLRHVRSHLDDHRRIVGNHRRHLRDPE